MENLLVQQFTSYVMKQFLRDLASRGDTPEFSVIYGDTYENLIYFTQMQDFDSLREYLDEVNLKYNTEAMGLTVDKMCSLPIVKELFEDLLTEGAESSECYIIPNRVLSYLDSAADVTNNYDLEQIQEELEKFYWHQGGRDIAVDYTPE